MVGGKSGILAKDGPRKEEEGKVCEHCSGRLRGTDLLSGRILFGNGSVCVCVYYATYIIENFIPFPPPPPTFPSQRHNVRVMIKIE